jgi:hypothetical protein
LKMNIENEHWKWTLKMNIENEHWKWTLKMNIENEHWKWTLKMNIENAFTITIKNPFSWILQYIRIRNIHRPEGNLTYNASNHANDFVIVELNENVTIHSGRVQPACIWQPPLPPTLQNLQCGIQGWGRTHEGTVTFYLSKTRGLLRRGEFWPRCLYILRWDIVEVFMSHVTSSGARGFCGSGVGRANIFMWQTGSHVCIRSLGTRR